MPLCPPAVRFLHSAALVLGLVLAGGWGGRLEAAEEFSVSPEAYRKDALPLAQVRAHVEKLAGLKSRVSGSEGCLEARRHIVATLREIGYEDGTDPASARADDLVPPTTLSEAVLTPDGQALPLIAPAGPPEAIPGRGRGRAVRLTLLDADDSLKGGKVLVRGAGAHGIALSEELKFPPSAGGKAEVEGDKAFVRVDALTLLEFEGSVTPGADAVSAGIGSRFRIGLQHFWGLAPHDPGWGKLELQDPVSDAAPRHSFPLYALWPNGTAITATGKDGLEGTLLFAKTGQPQDYDGLNVKDALVLLDLTQEAVEFAFEKQWTYAAGLGAKGAILIEPSHALRPRLERLFLAAPVEFPRFWIPRAEGLALKEALQARLQAGGAWPTARAQVPLTWKNSLWENVFLLVPGSHRFALAPADEKEEKELNESTVILAAYYDSISVVPALAPGAEQALSCAALLELARAYRVNPPPRDTLLLFCAGHFEALKGEREFFAEVERYDADGVEQLPDVLTDIELYRTLGKAQIGQSLMDDLDVRQLPATGVDQLREKARKAIEEYHKAGTGYEELTLLEHAAGKGYSLLGLVSGICLLLLGIFWWSWRLPGRGLGVAAALITGLTVLLYSALLPELRGGLVRKRGIENVETRLNELFKTWRDEVGTLESEKEGQARVLRAEVGVDAAPYKALHEERLRYESADQALYAFSPRGADAPRPAPDDAVLAKLEESAARCRERLKAEVDWARQEAQRRLDNVPFRRLVQARLARASKRKSLFLSLDLSAGHPGFGLFYKGFLYFQPGDIESRYKSFGRTVMAIARGVEKAGGAEKPGDLIPDSLLESAKRGWWTYQGVELAVAAEVAVQAQLRGLTLATAYDRRMAWDTPQDACAADNSYLKWENVGKQLELLGPFLRHFMAAPGVSAENRFDGLKYSGYAQLIFQARCAGGSQSIFPDIPIPGAVVLQVVYPYSCAGVRLAMSEGTNPRGLARVVGVRRGGRNYFDLNKSDPATGEIVYAINKPKNGLDENKTFFTVLGVASRQETLELFRCQGLAALDLVDPRYLVPLKNVSILAGQTESKPLMYGSSHGYPWEPFRVVFAEPGSRVKLLFREGQFGLRLAVLEVAEKTFARLQDPAQVAGVTNEEARGRGVRLGERKVLDWLPLRTATDLWCLGERRLESLRQHSIGNSRIDNPAFPGAYSRGRVSVSEGSATVTGTGVAWDEQVAGLPFRVLGTPESYRVEALEAPGRLRLDRPFGYASAKDRPFLLTKEKPGLHNLGKLRLQEAWEARAQGRLGEAWRLATGAWGLESRAYPEVLGTANDSVMGVVFYLFLLLPFCFFVERLLFAYPKIEQQIGAFFSIFILMFILLWYVHPAFELVAAPPVILLAFIIMSLAGIVIGIVYSKFNAEMARMQQGVQGVQSADVNRASAGLVAVNLGISQMRRRKMRTVLTCVTVVLLTFTALSFTSTVRSLSQAHIVLSPGAEKDAPYSGFLLRQLNFDVLHLDALEQLHQELTVEGLEAAPRFWKVAQKDRQLLIDLVSDGGGIVSPTALLGLSPYELKLFPKLGQALVAGTWLQEGDRDVCLLPVDLVKNLRPKDVDEKDWTPEKAIGMRLKIGSYAVAVRGIFKADTFNEIRDLDNETLTPADFAQSEASRGSEQKADQTATLDTLEGAKSAKYEHISPTETVIVPWQLSMLLGAELRAVAARVENPRTLEYLTEDILKRLEKNLFVGRDGRRILYASTGRSSLLGLGNLVVPLLIAMLILLNTMVGAVYERNWEIRCFSALGLAPSHIAALFLAEALVYATLGAILGYLLGQGVAKFLQLWGESLHITGLYLNYSSSSTVFVTALVMSAVLLSTLYPAVMAARAASPSEERRWALPPPVGDEIALELPFSFQRDLVPGVALFLHEFFESHAESSLGKFTAKEVTLEAFHTEQGQGICLFFMAWLTPYDLGVSQEVQIFIVPVDGELYVTEASFFRVSGYMQSWRRVNLPFLNALRKHFLIWRTYSPEQRLEYAGRGYYQFMEAFEAVGWPPPEGVDIPGLQEHEDLADEDGLESGAAPPERAGTPAEHGVS